MLVNAAAAANMAARPLHIDAFLLSCDTVVNVKCRSSMIRLSTLYVLGRNVVD